MYAEEAHRHLIDEIRGRVTRKGWSVEELADKAELSRGYVWRLLAGQSSPTLDTICKLADALDCRPRLLLP